MDTNEVVGDRHVAIHDIPQELTWQAHRCHLNGNIRVIKLTIEPEVEQPAETDDPAEDEPRPFYGVPDLSPFYD
jgi:hypothetical protein